MVNMLAIIVICTKFAAKLVKKRSYHTGYIQSQPENIFFEKYVFVFHKLLSDWWLPDWTLVKISAIEEGTHRFSAIGECT
jgi:hypothetical protein